MPLFLIPHTPHLVYTENVVLVVVFYDKDQDTKNYNFANLFFYECEAWSPTLREKRRLRAFKNGMLRNIFGPKRDEATVECKRLHNEEPDCLPSSPNSIRVIKSGIMRWAGHVARMRDGRSACRALVRKS